MQHFRIHISISCWISTFTGQEQNSSKVQTAIHQPPNFGVASHILLPTKQWFGDYATFSITTTSIAASLLPSVTISDKEYFRECIMVRVYSQPGQKIQTSVDQIFSGFAEVQIEISWSMNDPTLYTHVNAVCSFRALLSHLRLGERWCPPPPPSPTWPCPSGSDSAPSANRDAGQHNSWCKLWPFLSIPYQYSNTTTGGLVFSWPVIKMLLKCWSDSHSI